MPNGSRHIRSVVRRDACFDLAKMRGEGTAYAMSVWCQLEPAHLAMRFFNARQQRRFGRLQVPKYVGRHGRARLGPAHFEERLRFVSVSFARDHHDCVTGHTNRRGQSSSPETRYVTSLERSTARRAGPPASARGLGLLCMVSPLSLSLSSCLTMSARRYGRISNRSAGAAPPRGDRGGAALRGGSSA